MSRNSITPSRALRTIGVLVLTSGGSPFGPGRQSRTAHAQLATGFGEPTSSTRHMRQLPAIDRRSWKQKRGISAPAASHACSSVYSGGTSISLPSTMSLVISRLLRCLAFLLLLPAVDQIGHRKTVDSHALSPAVHDRGAGKIGLIDPQAGQIDIVHAPTRHVEVIERAARQIDV